MTELAISIERMAHNGVGYQIAQTTNGRYIATVRVPGIKRFINMAAATQEEAISLIAALHDAGYMREAVDAAHDVYTVFGTYHNPRVEIYVHQTFTQFGRNRVKLVYWCSAANPAYVAPNARGVIWIFADDRKLYITLPHVYPCSDNPPALVVAPTPTTAPVQYSLFEGV